MKNNEEELKVIQDMQAVVEQMRLDDIAENPDCENEMFECDCCAKTKPLAGSVFYSGNKRLCNECVLLAEVSFSLGKIKNIQELLDNMEDNRLEEFCNYIKEQSALEKQQQQN